MTWPEAFFAAVVVIAVTLASVLLHESGMMALLVAFAFLGLLYKVSDLRDKP